VLRDILDFVDGNTFWKGDKCGRFCPGVAFSDHILSDLRNQGSLLQEREFFIDNLLDRIHFIIVVMRWTD